MIRQFGRVALRGVSNSNVLNGSKSSKYRVVDSLKTCRFFGSAQAAVNTQQLYSAHENELLDCVKVDFSTVDCNDIKDSVKVESIEQNLLSDIESYKPEVVFVEKIQENHYWMKLMSDLKNLGYMGSFEDVQQGRGKGVFIRTDLLENDGLSKQPDYQLSPNPGY